MILTRGLGRGGPLVTAGLGLGSTLSPSPAPEIPAGGRPQRAPYWTPPQPATIVLTGRAAVRLQICTGRGGTIHRISPPAPAAAPVAANTQQITIILPGEIHQVPEMDPAPARPANVLTGRAAIRIRIRAGRGGAIHRTPPPWIFD